MYPNLLTQNRVFCPSLTKFMFLRRNYYFYMRHDFFLCKLTDKLERQHNITRTGQLHAFPNLMYMFVDCRVLCSCLHALRILFASYHIVSCYYPCARVPFCSSVFLNTYIFASPFPRPLALIAALFSSHVPLLLFAHALVFALRCVSCRPCIDPRACPPTVL